MAVFERTWTTKDEVKKTAFCVDYYDPQGRKRRRTFSTMKDAKRAEAAIKADLLRGEFRFAKEDKVLFDDIAGRWVDAARLTGKKVQNFVNSKRRLMDFFGGMFLSEITVRDIEDYKRRRKDTGVSGASVNRELMALSGIFTMARKERIFAGENPVRDVEKFREERLDIITLTPDEKQAILAACSPRFRPIVVIALNTAMRKSEILGLRWEDIEAGIITLRKTKNRKVRQVPANGLVLHAIEGVERTGPWLFTSAKRKKALGGIRPWFGQVLEAAAKSILEAGANREEARRSAEKVRHLNFHALRHTAITDMIRAGIDVVTAAEIAGHSSIEITRRYCHPDAQDRRRAVDVLAALNEDPGQGIVTQERHEPEAVPATRTESARSN